MLEVRDLCVEIRGRKILDQIGFDVSCGQWLMIVGPNGAGKTTLVNALTGGIQSTGSMHLQGEDLRKMSSAARARRIGVLEQQHVQGCAFRVEEVVRMGRYAHRTGFFRPASDEDDAAVEEAIRLCGLEDLRGQELDTLSGGELQRTYLAQAFCQTPDLLILDEPANHLDIKYQKQVFSLIRKWLDSPGRAVISIVHDLSLAKIHATHALLLDGGRQAGYGPADDVLRPELLEKVYGLDVAAWMKELYEVWE